MLVFAKNPYGILIIPGKPAYRIYGINMGRPPVDLPWKIHRHWRDMLEDATYTREWLAQRFNVDISPIAFRYKELVFFPYNTIAKLACELGIFYRARASKKLLCREIRYLLKYGKKYVESSKTGRKS